MKLLKLISAASVAAGFVSAASAAVTLNVTGSTAFRSATTLAEIALASHASDGTAASPVGAYVTPSSGGFTKATWSTLHGYLSDGTEIYIRNDWTGATAGVSDLSSGNTALTWVPTTATMSTLNSDGTGGTNGASNSDTSAPNVSMDDEQANDNAANLVTGGTTGATFAADIATAALQAGGTSTGANAGPVAAVTFVWTAGVQSDGNACPLSNVTQQQAAALLKNGFLPLSNFTGNSSDSTSYVLYTGRNEDSGTRVAYEAESLSGGVAGSGAYGAAVKQYMISQSVAGYPTTPLYSSLSVGSNVVNGFKLWTKNWYVNTIPTVNWNTTGHSGYNTGGDVATILKTPNPVVTTGWTVANAPSGFVAGTNKVYFVSSLGTSDALAVGQAGGTILTYNGVAFSPLTGSGSTLAFTTYNSVLQGQYSHWTTEYLYYLNTATGSQVAIGSGKAAADALADLIWNTPTSGLGNAGVNYNSIVSKKSGVAGGSFPQ